VVKILTDTNLCRAKFLARASSSCFELPRASNCGGVLLLSDPSQTTPVLEYSVRDGLSTGFPVSQPLFLLLNKQSKKQKLFRSLNRVRQRPSDPGDQRFNSSSAGEPAEETPCGVCLKHWQGYTRDPHGFVSRTCRSRVATATLLYPAASTFGNSHLGQRNSAQSNPSTRTS